MKKKLLPILLVTTLFVGTAAAGGGYYYSQVQSEKKIKDMQSQVDDSKKKIDDLEKEIDQETSGGSSAKQVVSPKGLFKVDLPQTGATISSPVRITGWANAFEGEFEARVLGASGNVLGTAHVVATAGSPGGGTFDATITFTAPASNQQGTVEVYELSQKDGSVSDSAKVIVTLKAK